MTYVADFLGQSSLFPCMLMAEALSYAKALQQEVFSYMVDDHPSKGHLTHTSKLTLIKVTTAIFNMTLSKLN